MDINHALKKAMELHGSGKLQEAEIAYRQILEVFPDHPDAIHFLGVLAYNVGNNDAAREYIQRAIELSPGNAACFNNMGNVCQQEGKYHESVSWYKKTIELNPDNIKAYNNLGVALSKLGRLDESVESIKTALRIDPAYFEARTNLSETYRYMGEYDSALKSCEEVLDMIPEHIQSRWNRSILWLLKGNFQQGWPEYEWRWKRPSTPQRKIDAGQRWDGSPFAGKTLFIYEEQGMGDTLQFIRYLPLVKQLGGHIIFEVLTPMIRLVESFKGFDRLWVGIRNVDTRPTDRFDLHIPLLSLPGILNTTIKNIPADIPYLSVDKDLVKIWKKRIKDKAGFKIGVVWAGHPGHDNDSRRSILLSEFSVLKEIKNIRLFSLQKEKYAKWTDTDPEQIFDQDPGEQISDFADTAAVIENLDLVICVDTAVAHLAGALGKKVWTLLAFSPDWRWMTDREDSPWYPTMRLFRQPAPGDWDSVFKKVKKYLARLLN